MTNETSLQRAVRLAQLTQGPLEQIRKQQEMMDRLAPHENVALKAIRTLEDLPQHRIYKQIEEMNRQSALIEAAQNAVAKPAIYEAVEAAQRRAADMQRLVDRAVLPHQSSILEMAEKAAKVTAPFESSLLQNIEWCSRLERQMKAVQSPWMSSQHGALSIEGFAVVSRLNTVIRHGNPYGDPEREIIDADLGDPIDVDDEADSDERDEAHVEAGMNPSMLAISPAGVGDVLIQTGFVLKAKYAPIPQTVDGSIPGHTFHPGHGALITSVEQNLRALIQREMLAAYGEDWVTTQVHSDVTDGWVRRREEAIEDGETPLDLIQYSNFMELKDIVIRKQHWNQIFGAIFIKKDHFATSMERLHPIRRPLAHSRPIGIGQQFHLISEAGLVLSALNIDIFNE